ncbi:MAG: PepSY-like domain-containing protein [Muribaculaceae bacterium]|nr:PepSY-like domain-containing protein [Muribaculaceae bacterium]
MKKLLKFLPLFLVALMAVTFWSCSDDDDFKPVANTELPSAAKTFLNTYYQGVNYQTKKDKDDNEYEVYLSNGHEVDFYSDGEWKDVKAGKKMNETVPVGFYPSEIDSYISDTHPTDGIHEISKERYGYDVELTNGTDIEFSSDGSFIRYDK